MLKRFIAIAGVILLLSMYILTFVFALTDNPGTMGMFKASLAMTIIVPVLLYAFRLVYKLLKK